MKKFKVEFEISVPDEVTVEQAEEWLLFQIGARGGMSADNPLADTDLEAKRAWVQSA
jgi:hypothetical protein